MRAHALCCKVLTLGRMPRSQSPAHGLSMHQRTRRPLHKGIHQARVRAPCIFLSRPVHGSLIRDAHPKSASLISGGCTLTAVQLSKSNSRCHNKQLPRGAVIITTRAVCPLGPPRGFTRSQQSASIDFKEPPTTKYAVFAGFCGL